MPTVFVSICLRVFCLTGPRKLTTSASYPKKRIRSWGISCDSISTGQYTFVLLGRLARPCRKTISTSGLDVVRETLRPYILFPGNNAWIKGTEGRPRLEGSIWEFHFTGTTSPFALSSTLQAVGFIPYSIKHTVTKWFVSSCPCHTHSSNTLTLAPLIPRDPLYNLPRCILVRPPCPRAYCTKSKAPIERHTSRCSWELYRHLLLSRFFHAPFHHQPRNTPTLEWSINSKILSAIIALRPFITLIDESRAGSSSEILACEGSITIWQERPKLQQNQGEVRIGFMASSRQGTPVSFFD